MMGLFMLLLAVVCAALAAIGWKLFILKLSKSSLDRQIDDLLTISDSLNRTQGRRAHKIAWRDKSIGDLVRAMQAAEAEEAG